MAKNTKRSRRTKRPTDAFHLMRVRIPLTLYNDLRAQWPRHGQLSKLARALLANAIVVKDTVANGTTIASEVYYTENSPNAPIDSNRPHAPARSSPARGATALTRGA